MVSRSWDPGTSWVKGFSHRIYHHYSEVSQGIRKSINGFQRTDLCDLGGDLQQKGKIEIEGDWISFGDCFRIRSGKVQSTISRSNDPHDMLFNLQGELEAKVIRENMYTYSLQRDGELIGLLIQIKISGFERLDHIGFMLFATDELRGGVHDLWQEEMLF
ncbi:Uncharacterized protein Rs2_22646 [Raphanus sativus]|nr:Uncharacterized protein Rs2_22646 [Raphanus sativus]